METSAYHTRAEQDTEYSRLSSFGTQRENKSFAEMNENLRMSINNSSNDAVPGGGQAALIRHGHEAIFS